MYRWVDHTAELELHLGAADAESVFAEALAALRELLVRGEESAEGAQGEGAAGTTEPRAGDLPPREVSARAPDRAALLAEWLGELLFLAETEELIPERVESIRLGADELEAIVAMRRGTPSQLVKAITYHGLSMREEDGAWVATVVLDV